MSAYMGRELELFVKSMGCGALLVLLYDGIRILRIIGKRMKYLDAAVDLLFWSAAGLFLFFTCLRENEGRMRAYLLCGILLGAGVWYWESGIFTENLHLFWQKGCIFVYKELQFFYL